MMSIVTGDLAKCTGLCFRDVFHPLGGRWGAHHYQVKSSRSFPYLEVSDEHTHAIPYYSCWREIAKSRLCPPTLSYCRVASSLISTVRLFRRFLKNRPSGDVYGWTCRLLLQCCIMSAIYLLELASINWRRGAWGRAVKGSIALCMCIMKSGNETNGLPPPDVFPLGSHAKPVSAFSVSTKRIQD